MGTSRTATVTTSTTGAGATAAFFFPQPRTAHTAVKATKLTKTRDAAPGTRGESCRDLSVRIIPPLLNPKHGFDACCGSEFLGCNFALSLKVFVALATAQLHLSG